MKTNLLKLALCAFVAALPMGAWADSTLFNLEMTATQDIKMAASTTGTVDLVAQNYATVTGGTVSYYQAQKGSSEVTYIKAKTTDAVTKTDLRYTIKDTYMTVTLGDNKTLQVGDVISFTSWDSSSNASQLCITNTSAESRATTYSSTDGSYTVKTGDAIIGLNSFKIWRVETNKLLYINTLTITRVSNTACSVDSSPSVCFGTNPNSSLPTAQPWATTGTWGGDDYSFTISGGNVRNYNNNSSNRKVTVDEKQYVAVLLTNNTYTITRSANIKSIKMYAITSSTSGNKAKLTVNGETELDTEIPLLSSETVTPAEFDITSYTTFKSTVAIIVAFKIEYYASASLTVADIEWASMYLPFAATIPSGTKVYYAKSTTSSAVTLEEITTGNIPVNTGVLVNASEGTYTFNALQSDATPLTSTNLFEGITASRDFAANEIYVLAGSENENANPLFKIFNAGTLSAYKAYIPVSNIPAAAESRMLNFVFEDDVTGVTEVKSSVPVRNDEVYNLNGQRVTADTKGIVIINGRKYMNK